VATLGIGVRVLAIQGFLKPVRVASGSMAPAFFGPHYEIPCGDCGFLLPIDASQAERNESVVCPNCGFGRNELAAAFLRPGERVVIDRGAFWLRRPRRFEPIAFETPDQPEQLAVKRVVGLPGEKVEVRAGELYVDGRLVRKTLNELRELAVPVYDDRFRPRDEQLPLRWQDPAGDWRSANGKYLYAGDLQPLDALHAGPHLAWLTYYHWRCSYLPGLRSKEAPVLDDYGHNLGPPRQLNFVTDLMLRCQVKTTGEGCLALSLHDGRETFELRLWPRRGEAALLRSGQRVTQAEFPRRTDETQYLIEAAICDQQFLAAIEGAGIVAHPYKLRRSRWRPSSRPLALGAAGLAVEASDFVVSRDIYYLPPPGRGTWRFDDPLSNDEYLVLGDNAAISQDSRTWVYPQLRHDQLLGLIRRWPY
jgi:signal peptidase I